MYVGSDASLHNIIYNPHSTILPLHLPGRYIALIEFWPTYAISIISAALGMAKCLKNGVARPIGPGGTLDGLLSGNFVLAILAAAGGVVARGLCIASTIEPPGPEVILFQST